MQPHVHVCGAVAADVLHHHQVSVGQCSHMCICVLAGAANVLHHHQVFIMTIFGAKLALITPLCSYVLPLLLSE